MVTEAAGARQRSPTEFTARDSRAEVIKVFNAVDARLQVFVAPLIARKESGEPRSSFSEFEARLIEGFEISRFVKRQATGSDGPLPDNLFPDSARYLAPFQAKGRFYNGEYKVSEGIPVNVHLDFLKYENEQLESLREAEKISERTYRRRKIQLGYEEGVLNRNSKPYADLHMNQLGEGLLSARRKAESFIIFEDKWRNRGDDGSNMHQGYREIEERRELVLPWY